MNLATANWSLIPAHCRDGMRQYIEHGILTGGFLEAVLENDLRRAVERADDKNVSALPGYVRFLYNYAPAPCWGNPGKVRRWIEQGGLRGQSKAAADPELAA